MLDDIPDEGLRKRLQDYSENPDEGQWDKIASEVRERMPLSSRLQTYHEEPDAFVWAKVSQGVTAERNMMWLERAGKFSAIVAYLLLLFPLTPFQTRTNQNLNNIARQETAVPVQGTADQANPQPAEDDRIERKSDDVKKDDVNKIQSTTSRGSRYRARKSNFNKVKRSPNQNVMPGYNDVSVEMLTNDQSHSATDRISIHAEDTSSMVTIDPTDQTQRVSQTEITAEIRSDVVMVNVAPEAQQDSSKIEKTDQIKAFAPMKNQETVQEKKSKKKRHYDLYALVMPTFGYQQISPVKDDDIIIESIEKISAFSMKRLGVRAEFGIEKRFYHRFFYHLGLVYFQRKQTIRYHYRDSHETEIHKIQPNSLTYQVSSPQDTATFSYQLKNIGVVAGINYTTKIGRFVNKVGFAGELHKGLSLVNREIDNGQRYYVFGDVYYRLSYPVSARLELMFQPTINYALQIHERINAPFYVKPYGLGLNFGAYFHF